MPVVNHVPTTSDVVRAHMQSNNVHKNALVQVFYGDIMFKEQFKNISTFYVHRRRLYYNMDFEYTSEHTKVEQYIILFSTVTVHVLLYY